MEAIREFLHDDRGYPDIPDEEESEDGKIVSEQEYWDNYYDHPFHTYEWNDGRLEERAPTDPSSYVMYSWFCELLGHFLKIYPVGMPMGLAFGFRLALPGKTAVRKPDLAFILKNNPVQPGNLEASYKGVFDLCVESLSHTGKKVIDRDTVIKKDEYATIGVREYYILDSLGVETAFYRQGKHGNYQQITPVDGVIRSDVLPGFRFRVSDLYSRPTLLEMANDEIYTDFVLPFYTEEKQKAKQERKRAEQERKKAEQERKRAEQERRKAERMEKKLRSLGLSERDIKSLAED